ncbi:hypothetical protein [Croceimicrobium sp.]|uniref:hypothetical protein n=1 Tax=Croceimicrobium sp. TaxID=2828340 RepID=UPI003BA8C724
MESLNSNKFNSLSSEEMMALQGGAWSKWKVIEGVEDPYGYTYYQRYNWWGLHATTDTRAEQD